jgi:hypothetical protein
MISEWVGNTMEGSDCGCNLRYYPNIFLVGQKSHEKSVRIAGLWAKIWKWDLPNAMGVMFGENWWAGVYHTQLLFSIQIRLLTSHRSPHSKHLHVSIHTLRAYLWRVPKDQLYPNLLQITIKYFQSAPPHPMQFTNFFHFFSLNTLGQ